MYNAILFNHINFNSQNVILIKKYGFHLSVESNLRQLRLYLSIYNPHTIINGLIRIPGRIRLMAYYKG